MHATAGLDRAVPNLPCRDFDRTEEFSGRFGFEGEFRDDDPDGTPFAPIEQSATTT